MFSSGREPAVAPVARQHAEMLAKHRSEMRQVAETPGQRDFADMLILACLVLAAPALRSPTVVIMFRGGGALSAMGWWSRNNA
jgi:hypothetical protein